MDFIEKIEQYFPEIKTRMETADKENIAKLEQAIGEALPDSFKALYAQYDGEKNEPYTGLFLGFIMMDVKNILETMKSFRENDFSEITSLTVGKVSDEKMCDRMMVPFAWDGSRGYFCLDMSPDTEGKMGQVVALDYDYDECTLLADSLEEFYEFVLRMLKEKKCYPEWEESEDEKYFAFETGHFFNVMKDILKEDSKDDTKVNLPAVFWRAHYEADTVPVSELQSETSLIISKEVMPISLAPVAYMSKLRELIIHNCTITDFESICGATELKKIVLVGCTFDYKKLAELSKLSKLKEVRLRKMPITDISCLQEIKNLKILSLMELKKLDATQVALFNKLQELTLEDIEIRSFAFLGNFKSLKKLEFRKIQVPDLDFLQYLKKLSHFMLHDKVEDESGLRFLKDLTQLKEFEYPVADMALYAGCEKLESIGIDTVGFQNPEALKGSKITGVIVLSANSREEAQEVIGMVMKHVELHSWGLMGEWMR